MTFLQLSTTWLWSVRLDERIPLPFSTFTSPRKAEPSGDYTGCFVLRGKLSPHLNDTAQHRKLNESWGRDIKNYLQNTHKLFQWLAPLHLQTPAYSSKQNWPGTEVLLPQPLSSQLFCGYFLKRIWGRDLVTPDACAPLLPAGAPVPLDFTGSCPQHGSSC